MSCWILRRIEIVAKKVIRPIVTVGHPSSLCAMQDLNNVGGVPSRFAAGSIWCIAPSFADARTALVVIDQRPSLPEVKHAAIFSPKYIATSRNATMWPPHYRQTYFTGIVSSTMECESVQEPLHRDSTEHVSCSDRRHKSAIML